MHLGRQGKFETSEKYRSKLGHRSPNWFPLPPSCTFFIARKWSYTFPWRGTTEQAHGFPPESAYSGTRRLTIGSTRGWLGVWWVDTLSSDHLYERGWRTRG